jgi:hypothetical protein
MFSRENRNLSDREMGVETPIPPITIYAAAPEGAPPRRIKTVEIIIYRFSWLWVQTGPVHAYFSRSGFFK